MDIKFDPGLYSKSVHSVQTTAARKMTLRQTLDRCGLFAVVVSAVAGAAILTSSLSMAQSVPVSDRGASATAQGLFSSAGIYVVAKGDSLYGIAQRFGLSVERLQSLNGMAGNAIFVGQNLRVHAVELTANAAPLDALTASNDVSRTETHMVKRGETAYRIAQNAGIRLHDLVRLNNLDSNYNLAVGQVLVLNDTAAGQALMSPEQAPNALLSNPVNLRGNANQNIAAETYVVAAPTASATSMVPLVTKASKPEQVALATPAPSGSANWAQEVPLTNTSSTVQLTRRRLDETHVEPRGEETLFLPSGPSAGDSGRQFTWPVRGRLLSSFGPRDGGLVNDGINIAVRTGEAVKAAAAGKVIYSSDEMDAFGNLVLIEHAEGWVTAYAHNERLHVSKGDRVTQGQTIARAGSSGTVDRSQLHFEVRRNGKPVNPMSVLNF